MCLAATACQAESAFTFSGYGTLGLVRTNTDAADAEFRAGLRQHKGASRSADAGVDTRLGLQAVYRHDEKLSAVGQLLTSRRDGEERPQVEWLYVQATPVQGLDLRAGRMVLPIFMISDNRNVGYAHYWVRAPQEVYGAYPLSSFDGVQARWRGRAGATNLGAQVSAGRSEGKLFMMGRSKWSLEYPHLYSVALTADHGSWSVSGSRTLGKDSELAGNGLPATLKSDDTFTNLALQYDDGQFVAMGEYVTRRYSYMGFGDSDSYYVSAGYRLGAWTPYALYGHFTPKGDAYRARNDDFSPVPGALPKGRTRALGVRWDAYNNVAVKLQVENVRRTDFAFANRSLEFMRSTPSVTAVSLAVDFVF